MMFFQLQLKIIVCGQFTGGILVLILPTLINMALVSLMEKIGLTHPMTLIFL